MSKFRLTLAPWTRALALGVLVITATLAAAPAARAADEKDKDKEPKCAASKAFQDKYKIAADAANKQDWPAALQAAKDVYAVSKLPCEQVYAVTLQRTAAYNAKNQDELIAAATLMNTVPTVTEKDKVTNLQVVYQTLVQQKKYAEAIPALKAYLAVKAPTPEDWDLLAQLSYQEKDCAGTTEAIAKIRASQPATEHQLLMAQDCYYKGKDSAAQAQATEELLKRWPKESYMIGVLAANQEKDELQLLNLYRLAFAKGYLTRQAQIMDYATMADRAGVSAEAQKVLEKAAAEKWITLDDKNAKQLAAEKRSAADDKKGLAALDKEARAGSSGKKDIAVGYADFGFEDYAGAVDAIKRGLAAGRSSDIKRVDDANMVLGISLARLGKYDEAAAAFEAAKADPRMAKAAEIWLALMKG